MFVFNRNKIRQSGEPKNLPIDDNIANSVYLRDYYIKDFKYLSPDVLNVKAKLNNELGDAEEVSDRSLVELWLKETMRGLKQFFYEGSLHGVKYIFEPSFGTKEKATWIVIMVISIAICAVNIIQLFCKWTSTPFVNVIDSVPTPIWAVPFPTVVLCPHLHVKSSFAKISELNDMEQFFASLVCPTLFNKNKAMNHRLDDEQITLLQQFIVDGAPKCEEVVKSCNWPVKHDSKWEIDDCCELFQPIFTNYGLCYAFNSLPLNGMTNDTLSWQRSFNKKAAPGILEWGLDIGYPKVFPPDLTKQPFRVMASGEMNGLGIELFLNNSEHQFNCDGNSLGFTILISSPTDHVYTSTVLRLPMDRMTTVEVSPITYKTDTPLRSLRPDQRQCFFQNERKLDFYEFYTDSNCKHDLFVKESRKTCNCVRFNWPRKHSWDPVCTTKQDFECINNVQAKVEEQLIYAYYADCDEQRKPHKETTSCHPSCNDVIYASQVFYSDLVKEPKGDRHWGDPRPGEVTQINVHFYDDMFLGQHRHAQYDDYYFVGAIGGLLSLFLGFSIISVAELVYFVMLRPAYVVVKMAYCRSN